MSNLMDLYTFKDDIHFLYAEISSSSLSTIIKRFKALKVPDGFMKEREQDLLKYIRNPPRQLDKLRECMRDMVRIANEEIVYFHQKSKDSTIDEVLEQVGEMNNPSQW